MNDELKSYERDLEKAKILMDFMAPYRNALKEVEEYDSLTTKIKSKQNEIANAEMLINSNNFDDFKQFYESELDAAKKDELESEIAKYSEETDALGESLKAKVSEVGSACAAWEEEYAKFQGLLKRDKDNRITYLKSGTYDARVSAIVKKESERIWKQIETCTDVMVDLEKTIRDGGNEIERLRQLAEDKETEYDKFKNDKMAEWKQSLESKKTESQKELQLVEDKKKSYSSPEAQMQIDINKELIADPREKSLYSARMKEINAMIKNRKQFHKHPKLVEDWAGVLGISVEETCQMFEYDYNKYLQDKQTQVVQSQQTTSANPVTSVQDDKKQERENVIRWKLSSDGNLKPELAANTQKKSLTDKNHEDTPVQDQQDSIKISSDSINNNMDKPTKESDYVDMMRFMMGRDNKKDDKKVQSNPDEAAEKVWYLEDEDEDFDESLTAETIIKEEPETTQNKVEGNDTEILDDKKAQSVPDESLTIIKEEPETTQNKVEGTDAENLDDTQNIDLARAQSDLEKITIPTGKIKPAVQPENTPEPKTVSNVNNPQELYEKKAAQLKQNPAISDFAKKFEALRQSETIILEAAKKAKMPSTQLHNLIKIVKEGFMKDAYQDAKDKDTREKIAQFKIVAQNLEKFNEWNQKKQEEMEKGRTK